MASQMGRPTASEFMSSLGLVPDPWQTEVLEGGHSRLLLNCARQSGKSTVVAVLALVEAICTPGTKVLLLSRSHRHTLVALGWSKPAGHSRMMSCRVSFWGASARTRRMGSQ